MSLLVCIAILVSCTVLLCESKFSIAVTGDVNLNPNLDQFVIRNFSYVWNDMLDVLKSADVRAINHESTLAGRRISDPNVIQFEDPPNYIETYGKDGVDASFISQANNHQFDFSYSGLATTVEALNSAGYKWGGVGATLDDVQKPVVIQSPTDGTNIAFFTMVVDECWKNANGTLYYDGCTCGSNAGPPPAYQCYAAGTQGIKYGLWYNFGITQAFVAQAVRIVDAYKKANPNTFVVVFLHMGPNFQWQPYKEHEQFLRSLANVSDLVWGTSSHHIQRFEVVGGTPVIYGLGDLLFRHVVGVDDFCPEYAIPCEQYRPELSLVYKFNVQQTRRGPRVDTSTMLAYPTRHNNYQTFRLQAFEDIDWVGNIFNELSPNVNATYDRDIGAFRLAVQGQKK